MEKLVDVLDAHCTFPAIEKVKLFKRCLFNYLVGNEDMHLKNFSLITRNGKVELAPGYDFLNTTLAFMCIGKRLEDIEEIALPLKGRKKRLSLLVWRRYYGMERLGLNEKTLSAALSQLQASIPTWRQLLSESFLPTEQVAIYKDILSQRSDILFS